MLFGIMLPHFRHVASPEAIRRVAQEAEALGYDSVWITDRTIISPGNDEETFGRVFYDALATLVYAAACTRRVKLGTSVLILPYRNPISVARETATLDVLSQGRLILGVGMSGGKAHTQREYRLLKAPFDRRGAATNEGIRVIKELWTNPNPSFQGELWQFSDIIFEPRPVQKPRPPIWIGGNSKRALQRTLELGDGWHPSSLSLEGIAQGAQLLKEQAQTHNRVLEEIVIAPREAMKILHSPTNAPSPTPLIGTADQVSKSIERYQAAGASYLVMDLFFLTPELYREGIDSVLGTMETFARKVMPGFK